MIDGFMREFTTALKRGLAKAGISPDAIEFVELVGEATRIPVVQENIKRKALDLDNFIKDEFGIVPASGRIMETEAERVEEDLLSSAQIPVQIPTTAVPGSAVSSAQVVAPLPTIGQQGAPMNVARAQQAFPFDPIFAAGGGSMDKQGIMNTSRGRQMVV